MATTEEKMKRPEFGTPAKVENVIVPMQNVEDLRALDRAKINDLFNGKRPYSEEEEEKYQIQINVNWGEGKRIMRDANSQLNNALLHPGTLFQCTLIKGRVDKRAEWSDAFTKNIHRPLQEGISGKKFYFMLRNRNATVCMHGIGALLFANPFRWCPRFVPLEDLLIPTETYCDFSNLRYFAVNLYLTPGELADMALGKHVIKGWKTDLVMKVLASQRGKYNDSTPSTWRNQPEEMLQTIRENHGYYYSDAVPKIRLRYFFWREVDKPNQWYRVMTLREQYGDVSPDKNFLFDGGDVPFADDIGQILNVQFGDNNFVAPLKYHNVRGLGVDLYAPVETLNRLRCEFVQHVFEQLKMLFKISNPADRDRLKQFVLQQYGFIPDGLSIVPRAERHQIDAGLVNEAMEQLNAILQSSSSSYIADQSGGAQVQKTAKQAMIELNQANVLVSSMLNAMYIQEKFLDEEIVRRFCNSKSEDADVRQFRNRCIADGIPEDLLIPENWNVVPERVIGGGDKSLAQQRAGWLMENRTAYDPKSQQTILRLATAAFLDDNSKAMMLVPEVAPQATDGTYAAENVFGTLMNGVQVNLRTGIDQQGYIEGLLRMVGTVIQRITGTDNTGTPSELVGMITVIQNIGQHLMILSGDESQKARVKQYGDAIGKMTNLIKGFAQRQAQARQKSQSAQDPKAMAGAQAMILKAKVGSQIKQQQAAQRAQEKALEFELDQARENMRLMAEIKREDVAHRHDLLNESMSNAVASIQKISMLERGSED